MASKNKNKKHDHIPAGVKLPQDHKDAQAGDEYEVPKLSETPGNEYLKPLDEVDALEQIELSLQAEPLSDENLDTGERVRLIADLFTHVADNYVVDAEGFAKFRTGKGAAARCLNLVMAYVAEMGEGDAS